MLKSFKVVESKDNVMVVVARTGETWRLYGNSLSVGETIQVDWVNRYYCNWEAFGLAGEQVDIFAPKKILAKTWRDN